MSFFGRTKSTESRVKKGLLDVRMTERKLMQSIKKIQRNERKLLLEVRKLLDEGSPDEARLLAHNLVESRQTVKKLGRVRAFLHVLEGYFKEAHMALIRGEAVEELAEVLARTNDLVSVEDLERTFVAMEVELENLTLNMEGTQELLEDVGDMGDPLEEDEDTFVTSLITELQQTKKEDISRKVTEMVQIDHLLPRVPKAVDEEEEEEDGYGYDLAR